MGKEYSSTIWPILYFKADWPAKSYNFDLGVQVIKADKTTLEEITEWSIDNNCWLSNIQGADNMRWNTDWFLAMHCPEVTEHVSMNEIGMSFADRLQESIEESFLITLQLVRSTAAICPYEFPANIQEDSIDEVDSTGIIWGLPSSDKPPVYLPETFEISDLQLLRDLWSAILNLRKLDFVVKLCNKEEFFVECDKKAGEDATKRMVDFIMSHPACLAFSEEERKEHEEKWTSSIGVAEDKGEWWHEYYKESFQKIFSGKLDELFVN